jgi:hypothetical protein
MYDPVGDTEVGDTGVQLIGSNEENGITNLLRGLVTRPCGSSGDWTRRIMAWSAGFTASHFFFCLIAVIRSL